MNMGGTAVVVGAVNTMCVLHNQMHCYQGLAMSPTV